MEEEANNKSQTNEEEEESSESSDNVSSKIGDNDNECNQELYKEIFKESIDSSSSEMKKRLVQHANGFLENTLKFVAIYDANKERKTEFLKSLNEVQLLENMNMIKKVLNILKQVKRSKNRKRRKDNRSKSLKVEERKQAWMYKNRISEYASVKDFVSKNSTVIINSNELPYQEESMKGITDGNEENRGGESKNIKDFTSKKRHRGSINDYDKKNYTKIATGESVEVTKETETLKDSNEGQKAKTKEFVFDNWEKCYICKLSFHNLKIHNFYQNICKGCGDFNYKFRVEKLDLTGRLAIVTGGRVKIGYQIALKLLSFNCKVIVTSRFPVDTLNRFKQEPSFESFKHNLVIYPLDLRLFPSVSKFIQYMYTTYDSLDILINNAAQTLRHNSSYFEYLLEAETKNISKEDEKIIVNERGSQANMLPNGDCFDGKNLPILNATGNPEEICIQEVNSTSNNKPAIDLSALPISVSASQLKLMEEKHTDPFKDKLFGQDLQPVDFSLTKNSWNLQADEVSFTEFAEVQVINAWAPFFLCAKLKPLMCKSSFQDKYIVNVTAVEGIFNTFKKSSHPHTNMAKASLNMFTRTSGEDFKKSGIYMTCVDTGWVSAMNEYRNVFTNHHKFENEILNVPLDELDGAMRVIHPIIEGVKNKKYMYGILLKDYKTFFRW